MSQQVNVSLAVQGAAQTSNGSGPAVKSVSDKRVVIAGSLSTPNPCYKIEAAMSGGNDPTLTLTANAQPGFCAQVVGNFDFEATVTGLSSGSHRVTVVYTYPNTGWDEKSHNLTVEVP